jgi:5-methylcytosine-specific restriction endonuclease McrA
MKIFLLTLALSAFTGGLAMANNYDYNHACASSNSRACRDARAAYAEHHNGQSPEQWNNHWYQGQQGRWSQRGSDWRWDGMRGDRYSRGHSGWQWSGAGHRENNHDRD